MPKPPAVPSAISPVVPVASTADAPTGAASPDTVVVAGFEQFGFTAEVMRGVNEAGFKVPSPIQAQAIPLIQSGRDLIAQAQTGTGKTAAFGLPAMNRLTFDPGVHILVITPTRELAAQVSEELFKLGHYSGAKTVAVYGGQSSRRQLEMIVRGANIVVATPGRLLDHLSSGNLKNFSPATVIIDEADEMLDMGFLEDITKIFTYLPEKRQTLMFSATMPPPIRHLAEKILKNPVTVNLTATSEFKTDIEQHFYVIEEAERTDAISRLIDSEEPKKSIIFCRTKRETDALSTILSSRGCAARPLHGDMEQDARQLAIAAFKKGKIDILVATDVAARGIDISDVTHVFNYHMPFDQESYVHRIGRTGRAGKKGKAVTLVTPWEFRSLKRIQHALKASFIHGEIPSIADVHSRRNEKLIKAVCAQPMHDGVVEVLSQLTEEMDVAEAAGKLLSMLIESRIVSGPDHIGMKGQRLESLVSGKRENQGYRPARDTRFKPHGGGGSYGNNFGNKPYGDRKFQDRPQGDGKFADRKFADKKYGDKKYPDKKSDQPAAPVAPAKSGSQFTSKPPGGGGQVWDGQQWVKAPFKPRRDG